MCVGLVLPVVRRMTCPPSLLATHKSCCPSTVARQAIRLPSPEMAQWLIVIGEGCLTRRWMPSQSISLLAGVGGCVVPAALGFCRLSTYALGVFCTRWLMNAILLPVRLQVTSRFAVAKRVMLRGGSCAVGPPAGMMYSSLASEPS